jgi:hypothetical protein
MGLHKKKNAVGNSIVGSQYFRLTLRNEFPLFLGGVYMGLEVRMAKFTLF